MTNKAKGANCGARRFVKAVAFSPARVKTPKRKKPVGYQDEEDDNSAYSV